MKYLHVIIAIFWFTHYKACPHCNIHNYLYSNVVSAKSIVKVQVIDTNNNDGTCSYVIIDIIRNSKDLNHFFGDTVKEAFYSNVRDTGNYILFDFDGFPQGVWYSCLDTYYEYEIRFLAKSPEHIDTKAEALKMITGVSIHSNSLALDYIEEHYDSCYEDLTDQLESLITKSLSNEDVLFMHHKINNLIKAIHVVCDLKNETFLLSMTDVLLKNDSSFNGWNDLFTEKNKIIGETLANFIKYDKSKLIGKNLESYYLSALLNNDSPKNIYYSYALSSQLLKNHDFISKATNYQKDLIAYGLLKKSFSFYFFEKREIKEHLMLAKKIAKNKDLLMLVDKSLEKVKDK